MNLSDTVQELLASSSAWASEPIGSFNGNPIEVRVMRHAIANWHIHPQTDEMFVVLSGSMSIDTDKGSFDLKANDCLVIKAGTRHRARTESIATLMTLIQAKA